MTNKMILENRLNITDSAELACDEERISKRKLYNYLITNYLLCYGRRYTYSYWLSAFRVGYMLSDSVAGKRKTAEQRLTVSSTAEKQILFVFILHNNMRIVNKGG